MPKKELENIAYGVNTPETICKVFGDDEVLTSPEDIDYYKTVIKEFEASNRLVGEINDEGEYVINEKVRRDLALLPKEKLQEGFHLVEAFSHVLGKDLYFSIEVEEDGENFVASLFLQEKVSDYGDMQSLKSFIARIVQPRSDDFVAKVLRVFNVQDSLTDFDEGRFINLVLQIQNQIDYWFELEDIVELSSQIYILRMLSLLENEGDLGRKVIQEYNRRMSVEGLDNTKVKKRHLGLRKILDEVIKENGGEKEVFKKNLEQVKEVKKEFSAPIQKVENLRKKQVGKSVIKKVEKPAPAKEASKPSKAGEKSAGKKDDKKKDNKKKDDKKKDKKKDDKKKDDKKKDEKKSGGSSIAKAEPDLKVPKLVGKGKPPVDNSLDILGKQPPVIVKPVELRSTQSPFDVMSLNVGLNSFNNIEENNFANMTPQPVFGELGGTQRGQDMTPTPMPPPPELY